MMMMRCFLRRLWFQFYSEILPPIILMLGIVMICYLAWLTSEYLERRFGGELLDLICRRFMLVLGLAMLGWLAYLSVAWCIKTWKECKGKGESGR